MSSSNTIASPKNGFTLGVSIGRWFTPRSVDREEAFRERVIRSIVGLLIFIGLLSFASTIFIFHSPWAIISFPSVHVVALLMCAAVAVAVSRGSITASGWLLIMAALVGISGIVILAKEQEPLAGTFLGFGPFMIAPLISASVLPRRSIIPISILSAIFCGLSHFAIRVNNPTVIGLNVFQQLINIFFILLTEGLLLRQLRVEFDDRHEAMKELVRQTELAKVQAEAARVQAEADRQRAEKADAAKTQFLANMSHELRTPLNAIIGYDEAMIAGMVGSFDSKQIELLGYIQKNSRRLLGLINDVLDLSKIESGNIEVFLSPMPPRKVIAETTESLQGLAQEKNIGLITTFSESLPEIVLCDARKLEQILVNLLGNAIKFTSEGEVRVEAGGIDEKHWEFIVRDTGIGMNADAVTTIFEPFRQLDNSMTRKYKGTGLGLAITKRLVDKFGGTITVDTEVGKGSAFRIVLPNAMLPQEAESITVEGVGT